MAIGYGMQPAAEPEPAAASRDPRTKQARWFAHRTALWRAAGVCVRCGGTRDGRWLRCARCLTWQRQRYTPRRGRRKPTPPTEASGGAAGALGGLGTAVAFRLQEQPCQSRQPFWLVFGPLQEVGRQLDHRLFIALGDLPILFFG